MGDDLRQDEPEMEPDERVKVYDNDDAKDDVEGHGGGKWSGAKDEAPGQSNDDASPRTPSPDDVARWSDVNLKAAIVPVRW